MNQDLVALIACHEMEFVGTAPAPFGEVVKTMRRGHDMAWSHQKAGAVTTPAGIDAADGAPGILHGLHEDAPVGLVAGLDGCG